MYFQGIIPCVVFIASLHDLGGRGYPVSSQPAANIKNGFTNAELRMGSAGNISAATAAGNIIEFLIGYLAGAGVYILEAIYLKPLIESAL